MLGDAIFCTEEEIKVSFGYKCNGREVLYEFNDETESSPSSRMRRSSRSFSCLSGAALSANSTLANTNICNGFIGAEILPCWDSPKSFRRIPSSPSSLHSTLSNMSSGSYNLDESPEDDSYLSNSPSDGFLNAMEVQVAGGAAGEDRVQAVCSEEDGWLFCAIYDGFNGRDAADFLACTLYDSILMNLNSVLKHDGSLLYPLEDASFPGLVTMPSKAKSYDPVLELDPSSVTFRSMVKECLLRALSQAENDFLAMVEREMDDRPDIVSVGSCVLVSLLLGKDLYTMSLGDSRAVLATYDGLLSKGHQRLKAIQLTEIHTTDNEAEKSQLLLDHPDDPSPIKSGKVKGKLKVTRAFGVGYLKKKNLNDALMGILKVDNLISPPYVSLNPSTNVHRISETDHFVIVASDGLFDFFTNEEAVKLVHSYILSSPTGDPAKYLLEKLVAKAAYCAGFTKEELMNVSPPRRRKYHDDVTVMVIILGTNKRTSKASTFM